MNEELYHLYKTDKDFQDYVDKYCKAHNFGVFEVLDLKIFEEYGKYLKERKKSDETMA